MRLLLISNSTRFGERYLDHCANAITSLLGSSIQRVLFVPYALHDATPTRLPCERDSR
jgi:peptidase E